MTNEQISVILMKDISKTYYVGGEEVRALDKASMNISWRRICQRYRAVGQRQIYADEYHRLS
jgi:hypothetical protein